MTHGSGAPPEQGSTRTIGLAMLVVFLLSYPWLAPGLQTRFVSGVPLVLIYLFAVWGLCIALAAFLRAEP